MIGRSKYDVDTSYGNLWHAFDSVAFLGSTPAVDAALKVADKANDIRAYYFAWDITHPNPETLRTKTQDELRHEQFTFLDESNCLTADLDDADQKFNNAGRDDLGMPPLPYFPFERPASCPTPAH